MNVKENIESLLHLQEIDVETRSIQVERDEIPEHNAELEENVDVVRVILQKEHDQLADAEALQRSKMGELDLQRSLLEKSKEKLRMSANEKQSKAAQREIDSIKKTISDQEKSIENLMEAIDQYKSGIDSHAADFKTLEDELALSKEEGEKRIEEINQILAETEVRRKEITTNVDEQMNRLYARILKRMSDPIAVISDDTCSACKLRMLPQAFIEVQKGEQVIQCQNCKRMFLFQEVKSADDAEDAKAEADGKDAPAEAAGE